MLSRGPYKGTSKVSSIFKDSRRPTFSDSKILQSQESKTQRFCMLVTDIIPQILPCLQDPCSVWPLPSFQTHPQPCSPSSLQPHWPSPRSQNILSLSLPQDLCTCLRIFAVPSVRIAPFPWLTLPHTQLLFFFRFWFKCYLLGGRDDSLHHPPAFQHRVMCKLEHGLLGSNLSVAKRP